jgi:DNA sulfur modification protein DndD
MSTIVDSISLCNFFNYYGDYEQNVYEFNPGLNVIIADNGNGKSKLFSTFSGILKDEVIDSDKDKDKMVDVNKFIIMMISDKIKDETPVNSDVICGVRIKYSDEDHEYEVEKSAWARRTKAGSPTDSRNWDFGLNDVRVTKKEKFSLDFKPIIGPKEQKSVIDRLIRPEFLKYALFQGEEVDNILNFNDRASLKTALDALTNIKKIEKLITTTENLAERAEKDLSNEKKRITKSVDVFNKKAAELKDLKDKLEKRKGELSRYKDELAKARIELDNLINVLLNAEKREKLRTEKYLFQQEFNRIDYYFYF